MAQTSLKVSTHGDSQCFLMKIRNGKYCKRERGIPGDQLSVMVHQQKNVSNFMML